MTCSLYGRTKEMKIGGYLALDWTKTKCFFFFVRPSYSCACSHWAGFNCTMFLYLNTVSIAY